MGSRRPVEDNEFGARLRQLRAKLDVSQGELERATRLSHDVISKIENGTNKATTANIQGALADGIGISPELLRRFWRNEISVDDLAPLVKLRQEEPANAAAAQGADCFRWLALSELIRDGKEAEISFRAVAAARPKSPTPTWGDYYTAAKVLMDPAREIDFAFDPNLPRPTAEKARRKFAKDDR